MTTKLDKFLIDQGIRPMGTLAHVGIKGMKWGIRRSDAQLARSAAKSAKEALPRKNESADAARARVTQSTIKKTKSSSSVSDADLNHLVNRINLEKRYSEITSSKNSIPIYKSADKKINALLKVGDTMNKAYNFANSPAGRIVAAKLGLYKQGPGKHGTFPKDVISLPSRTSVGRHRK